MAATSIVEIALSATVVLETAENITDGLGAVARVSDVPFDGSDRYRIYTDVDGAATDLAASEIDQDTYDAIAAAYSQRDRPSQYIVIRQDVSGAESVTDALDAADALGVRAGFSYLFLLVDDRVAADHVEISAYAQARRAIAVFQSSDADWLTASVPAGYSTIVSNNQTVGIYEDTDTVQNESGWAGRQAAADPDANRPSGRCSVIGLVEYGTLLTSTQRTNALANNINYHAPLVPSGTARGVWDARTLDGTQFGLVYTKLYLELRIIQAVGALLTRKMNANTDIPGTAEGEAMVLSSIRPVLETARTANHIKADPDALPAPLPEGYTLTASISGTTLTIIGRASGVLGIVDIDVTINLAT